ncbi:MAG: orotidine-5'-phosphate decarboxylase [Oscillatoriales cyanobacterium RM2_1_1]|nr:orotidine-5'-phosphate decarboxylase [Oscillatoriales cyanobacterium SM2_3_0]NJO45733.1 orotidine-5'-phosphate decarboxylase [Oscillatoriales cyanobacterium RM2_1_1]
MNADRIIVSLDVSTLDQAMALVEQLPQVGFWKVGLELFVNTGPKILDFLHHRQKRIFLDLKFHDIPNTVVGACRGAVKYGVDLITIHGTAGRVALNAAREAIYLQAIELNQPPPRLIAISVLTSLSPRELAFDLKIPLELPEYALQMALLAKDCNLDGAVCSPQEVTQLREICGRDFLLICPGVRPEWAEAGDQRRSLTPIAALKAGADYLVIGRPITAAANPLIAWERICEEISVLDG